MVDGKPRPKKTIGRKIKDHQTDIATLYGLIASNEGAVSANTIGKSFGTGAPSTEKTGFLPLAGGQMDGPIGHTSQAIAISGGNLKINESAAGDPLKVQTIIFVSPESGTTDDLDTMEGRLYPGQHHILVGVSGNTITIKHNNTAAEDNDERAFLCPNSTDYELEGTEAVIVFYDDTNNKWRIIGDAVVGGGGGVNFPLQYPVDDQGNSTGTVTHDLDANTAHKLQFTATGDCDITLSNIPTGGANAVDFFIEITQDPTGGHAITFNNSEVVNPPTISTAADTTSLLSCHADGDGNVRIITLLNAQPTSGNFATKALDNLSSPTLNTSIDVNMKDLNNIDRAKFVSNTGTSATDANIAVNSADTKLVFNVPSGYEWTFTENNVEKWTMSPTTLTGANYVASNTVSISNSSTDPTTDGVFTVNGTDVKVYSGGAVRNLSNVGTAVSQIIQADTEVTITDVGAGNIVGKVDNIQQFSVSASSFSIDNDVNLGALSTDTITFNGHADSDLRMADNVIIYQEITTPANPSANELKLYAVDDGGTTRLAYLDSAGSETILDGSGVGDNLGNHTATQTLDLAGNDLILSTPSSNNQIRTVGTTVIYESDNTEAFRHTPTLFSIAQDTRLNGNELFIDDDDDTSIESSTDDTLNVKTGGSTRMTVSNTDIDIDVDLDMNNNVTVDWATTQSTVGSAGLADALPSNPTGYIIIKVNGTERVIPFYAKA